MCSGKGGQEGDPWQEVGVGRGTTRGRPTVGSAAPARPEAPRTCPWRACGRGRVDPPGRWGCPLHLPCSQGACRAGLQRAPRVKCECHWAALKSQRLTLGCSCLVAQSRLTLCSPPGASAHGILQARILVWVAISSSGGSSRPRDRTCISRIGWRVLDRRAAREALDCGIVS